MSILMKTSMKDQVYQLIKDRIMNQTYRFGEKINMLELAQELQISNSPIREALSVLESERLVVFTPHAGPSVITIDDKIFGEVQETARILLVGSYEQCVKRELIPQLTEMMEECLNRQLALENNPEGASDADFARLAIEFDVCIIRALSNVTLESLYKAFFNLLYMSVLYAYQEFNVDRKGYIEEHQKILDAIRSGSENEVVEMINRHFTRNS